MASSIRCPMDRCAGEFCCGSVPLGRRAASAFAFALAIAMLIFELDDVPDEQLLLERTDWLSSFPLLLLLCCDIVTHRISDIWS